MSGQPKQYIVVRGIDFPPNQRKEPGETVTEDELPKTSVKWLLADGDIRPKTKDD